MASQCYQGRGIVEGSVANLRDAGRQEYLCQIRVVAVTPAWHSRYAGGTAQVYQRTTRIIVGNGKVVAIDFSSHHNLRYSL